MRGWGEGGVKHLEVTEDVEKGFAVKLCGIAEILVDRHLAQQALKI